MTRRLPVVATIIVGLSVALMIALGVWQLQRKDEKERLIASYAAARSLPPIAFPRSGTGDELLFRRASVDCAAPVTWQSRAGRDANGRSGWRQIATCGGGAGPVVQLGISRAPDARPAWRGGAVGGYISHAPDDQPLIISLLGMARPKTLMLVTGRPAAGLAANARPDPASVPNNHLAYAVQWFLFAAIAAVIYALALRRRSRL